MNADLHELKEMHTYKRPYGSQSEAEYIARFLLPLGLTRDPFGNLYKVIGDKPVTMWSSHTDSVHHNAGRQNVVIDGKMLKLHKKSNASCLGADDAAGNWIMMQMIRAGVPGLYIFHYAEEVGAVGSSDIAAKAPDFVKGITSAIAFDRKGYDSIITHQGGRTASDAFAASLGLQLEGYKADDKGIFTDTRSYKSLIPECTNLSVGYFNAHSSKEVLDFEHLFKLRDMMLAIDQTKFVIERDPKQVATFTGSNRTSAPKTLADFLWTYPDDAATVLEMMGVPVADFGALVLEARDRRWDAAREKKRAKNAKQGAPTLTDLFDGDDDDVVVDIRQFA